MKQIRLLSLLLLAPLALITSVAHAQYSSPVRNVENPDRTPYREYQYTTIAAGYANNFISYPTPLGKQVVVEYASVQCSSQVAGDRFEAAMLYGTKALSAGSAQSIPQALIPLEYRGYNLYLGGYVYSGSMPVKVVSDPSFSGDGGLYFNLFRDGSGAASCFGSLVGHVFTP